MLWPCVFERQEIKDALSYLRLIANRNDDAAFERVVNTPTRGIGDRTLDVVRQTSRDRQLTLWQACRELLQEKALAGRAASALQRFMELIDALAQETADMPLHVQTDRVIKDSGLRTMYEQEKGEKGQTRIENLEELVTATRQFSYNEEDEDLMPLQAFLSHAALEAGEGQADTWQDAVQLMTLHSAKGLEFPQVQRGFVFWLAGSETVCQVTACQLRTMNGRSFRLFYPGEMVASGSVCNGGASGSTTIDSSIQLPRGIARTA